MLRQFPFGMLALVGSCYAQAALAAPPAGGPGTGPSSSACNLQIVANPTQWRVSGIDVFAIDPTLASFDVEKGESRLAVAHSEVKSSVGRKFFHYELPDGSA